MTDREIIQALECCRNDFSMSNCLDCPYNKEKSAKCITFMIEDALALFSRQQAEIERLQQETKHTNDLRLEIFKNKSVWEHLARAKAIKEFANEFEYEILHKEFWNDHPHTSQVWLNGYEQCMRDMRVMLKDKLKEMVGEDK